MLLAGLLVLAVLVCFSFVLLFGAPYLPTLGKQVAIALELAELRPGQTLLELGCGDGKVLVAAARRGVRAVGYELNPLLVAVAWARTRRYRGLVSVRWGNFWQAKWPETDVIFVFGLQRIMNRLNTKIEQSLTQAVNSATNERRVKLVSFAFKVPGRKAIASKGGVYLYEYHHSL